MYVLTINYLLSRTVSCHCLYSEPPPFTILFPSLVRGHIYAIVILFIHVPRSFRAFHLLCPLKCDFFIQFPVPFALEIASDGLIGTIAVSDDSI